MARPPRDPAGAGVPVSVRLAPPTHTRLDAICSELKLTRSQVVTRLINRTRLPSEKQADYPQH